MRKLLIGVIVAVLATVGMMSMPQKAMAQDYPSVSGLTAFTPEANFMSLAGYLRWKYLQNTGRWISREEAVQAVKSQGGM